MIAKIWHGITHTKKADEYGLWRNTRTFFIKMSYLFRRSL